MSTTIYQERNYVIYKHTSPSGESYIGQTKNYERRCVEHQKTTRCLKFNVAIKQYGWDNFIHEILCDDLTIEEANSCEIEMIALHETLYPHGYNMRLGGKNTILTPDIISKRSATRTKKIIIDNVRYESVDEASKKLNLAKSTIFNRCCSKKYPSYKILK